MRSDLVIAGGGIGGCAAAMAALRQGLSVILTEETDWIGGQLTQQAVPLDEHPWIESFGATRSYREFRGKIRDYYRRHYPLTVAARTRPYLNPGACTVSHLCYEPRVALAVLQQILAPYVESGLCALLLDHKAAAAEVSNDRVKALTVADLRTGDHITLESPFFIDATELGDLLPMTGTEFVTGSESRQETGELHAPEKANPENQQAFTVCFAMDCVPGEDHTIPRPPEYDFWRSYVPRLSPPWPGRLLDLVCAHPVTLERRVLGFDPTASLIPDATNLWAYRRIAYRGHFKPGSYVSDICLVNWPQNDYFLGNLLGSTGEHFTKQLARAKELSLSLLYWLQTEAPREDGKIGFPSLRLCPDILGTKDGLAKFPYIRESRRIRALISILEQHCGLENRALVIAKPGFRLRAETYFDSVGIGSYHIDLHPTSGGDNYIDLPTLPFQIPLGALLPERMLNILPGATNIGTTHITNGCYRLHPIEWNIGEVAGNLVAFAKRKNVSCHAVRDKRKLLGEFVDFLHSHGIVTAWPEAFLREQPVSPPPRRPTDKINIPDRKQG